MNLAPLEAILGHTFASPDLLRQALTHRSYLNEHPDFSLDHNERLEFLGDAVLELIVTDHLYHHYNLPEGELTSLRAAVVRGEMLSRIADDLELNHYLFLSRGERKDSTSKARLYILANAVEAVIGALYLDGGLPAAQQLIDRVLISRLPGIVAEELHIDSKSKFQELAQEKYRLTPNYRVLSESGLDHAKEFVVGAFIGREKMGEGRGTSKQEAQQQAAQAALKQLRG
jgi:ribonuclease-3